MLMDAENSLSIRAAWLAHVGGHTQEQIASRLGVSRMKAQRLLAAATRQGLVRCFIDGVPAECLALEDRLRARFGLRLCTVVPSVGTSPGAAGGSSALPRDAIPAGTPGDEIPAIATAAARYLNGLLETGEPRTIGVGNGRTLAALVERLPATPRPAARFVSLLGSFTRWSAANPYDVIARLAERTGSECYFMPVPFLADSRADARVLRAQSGVQRALKLVHDCGLCVVGIGELGAASQLVHSGSLTRAERQTLVRHGAVGELAGCFVSARGRPVDCEINERAVGAGLDDLRGHDVLAVAGGAYKAAAIRAVLATGLVSALIIDEAAAAACLHDTAATAATKTAAKTATQTEGPRSRGRTRSKETA